MTVKALIFDLDGVITDTAIFHFYAWRQLAEQLGIPFTEQDNEQLKGVDRLGSLRRILQMGQLQLSTQQEQELMAQKNNHYLQLIEQLGPQHLFAGVLTLFAQLKKQGIKIALASASKNAAFVVERLGIAAEFDYMADAAAVAHSKPAPDIFLLAAQGLELNPSQCVGVEDAVAGITAIRGAGMLAVGIGDPVVLTEAALVYPTLQQLALSEVLQLG